MSKGIGAQHDVRKLDGWINSHAAQMNGPAILMVYKNGQIIKDVKIYI